MFLSLEMACDEGFPLKYTRPAPENKDFKGYFFSRSPRYFKRNVSANNGPIIRVL